MNLPKVHNAMMHKKANNPFTAALYASQLVPSHAAAPMTALDAARLSTLGTQNAQRRIGHMKQLVGADAATKRTRLGYAKVLPILAGLGAGAGLGGLAGLVGGATYGGKDMSKGDAAGLGAMLGGGLGLLASILATGGGSIAGSISSVDRSKLKSRLSNLTAADYLVPGRAAYLQAQLNKDFLQNEQARPQQFVF